MALTTIKGAGDLTRAHHVREWDGPAALSPYERACLWGTFRMSPPVQHGPSP